MTSLHTPNCLGFTGTQRGMSERQLQKLQNLLEGFHRQGYRCFHHGDCVGADEEAAELARDIGYGLVCHPPVEPRKRAFVPSDFEHEPRTYLLRNHDIVKSVRKMIAAPGEHNEVLRSGTWATIRYTHKLHRSVTMVLP